MSSMSPKIKTRKAISAVLTTLIITVASVVLATGIVLYSSSLFQSGAQSSDLTVKGVHVWVNSTSGMSGSYAWGAAEIRNSGDKVIAVDTISVRGNPVPYSNWYFDANSARVTVANFQSQLNYTGTATAAYRAANPGTVSGEMQSYGTAPTGCATSATQFYINEYGSGAQTNPSMCFTQASGPIALKPGDKAVVYFQIPSSILGTIDQGSKATVSIFAGDVGSPQTIAVQSQT